MAQTAENKFKIGLDCADIKSLNKREEFLLFPFVLLKENPPRGGFGFKFSAFLFLSHRRITYDFRSRNKNLHSFWSVAPCSKMAQTAEKENDEGLAGIVNNKEKEACTLSFCFLYKEKICRCRFYKIFLLSLRRRQWRSLHSAMGRKSAKSIVFSSSPTKLRFAGGPVSHRRITYDFRSRKMPPLCKGRWQNL